MSLPRIASLRQLFITGSSEGAFFAFGGAGCAKGSSMVNQGVAQPSPAAFGKEIHEDFFYFFRLLSRG